MSWIKEFRDFASKGSLVDVAVAFVMGAAFGKVISSFTEGIVSPLISLITGGADLTDKKIILRDGSQVLDASGAVVSEVAEISLKYGAFFTAILDFIIVAWVMFLLIKAINRFKQKQEEAPAAPPEPSSTDKLLMEIRDALKK